jgi:hypothetical protein
MFYQPMWGITAMSTRTDDDDYAAGQVPTAELLGAALHRDRNARQCIPPAS